VESPQASTAIKSAKGTSMVLTSVQDQKIADVAKGMADQTYNAADLLGEAKALEPVDKFSKSVSLGQAIHEGNNWAAIANTADLINSKTLAGTVAGNGLNAIGTAASIVDSAGKVKEGFNIVND